MQGDIVAVYNSSGTKLASYRYDDAWGYHSTTYSHGGGSTGAQYNPFRYRGYYYDSGLGLYYLNSRYYDANTGRFISADGYVSTGQGLLGNNMFAYCNNNPVMNVDREGKEPIAITLTLGSVLIGAATGLVVASLLLLAYDVIHEQVLTKTATSAVETVFTAFLSIINPKAEEKEKTVVNTNNQGITYYHITTKEGANNIMSTGIMQGSYAEGGYVFAWRICPDKKAVKESGAHGNVIISFTTNTPFEKDPAFESDSHSYKYMPVRSVFPGPIKADNVQIMWR